MVIGPEAEGFVEAVRQFRSRIGGNVVLQFGAIEVHVFQGVDDLVAGKLVTEFLFENPIDG